jgi:hypothetical protein
VLDLLSRGHNPLQVSRLSGVSRSYIYRLHHSLGGVYRPQNSDYSGRYLDREERYELARLHDAGHSRYASLVEMPLPFRNVSAHRLIPVEPRAW